MVLSLVPEATHRVPRAAFPTLLRLEGLNSFDDPVARIFTHPDFIYDHQQPPEKIPGSARTTTTSPSIPTRSTQVGAAMRTADGAKFFRLNHQYARRAWLEQQLAA